MSPSQSSLRRVCPWQYPKETSRLGFRGMSFLLPALTKRTPRYPPSAEPSRQLEAAFEGKQEKRGPVRQQRETKKGTRRWRLPVCKAKENGIRHLKRVFGERTQAFARQCGSRRMLWEYSPAIREVNSLSGGKVPSLLIGPFPRCSPIHQRAIAIAQNPQRCGTELGGGSEIVRKY